MLNGKHSYIVKARVGESYLGYDLNAEKNSLDSPFGDLVFGDWTTPVMMTSSSALSDAGVTGLKPLERSTGARCDSDDDL